jgi:PhnB protein
MPQCCPYLYFDGNAEAAMRTYERVLGGELKLLRYSDAPPSNEPPPPGCEVVETQRVMHACLSFDGGSIMCSDAPNAQMVEPVGGMSINLMLDRPEEGRRVFEALAEGGQVQMPYAKTFWAEGFGMLKDRFGIAWMVGGGMLEVPPKG